eukprot:TRINITY_DN65508_c0_g1_i1.p1 TRINITY_DN65508_c0_g1~~TRINITY_DN65508_c0_g1_i1.p1  ORF type:complete len:523 (-),score=134.70 TRINITY_DN65508_c0_g1_i1:272-1840(-)
MSSVKAMLRLLIVGTVTVQVAAVGGGLMRREPKKSHLQAALSEVLGDIPAERLLNVEAKLRPSYEAFPKDARGQLPPHRVLPALVRAYFAKEHGWLVRGLEAPGSSILSPLSSSSESRAGGGDVHEVTVLQDKAPELAKALLEVADNVQATTGFAFSDIVSIVAAVEQLLLAESLPLLKASYELNGYGTGPADESYPFLDESQLHEVLQSYLLLFRHGIPRNLRDALKHSRMKSRARQSHDWPPLAEFENRTVQELHDKISKDGVSKISWHRASEGVLSMAERYGRWQNGECEQMKTVLKTLDRNGTGRVSLKDFHSEPAHNTFQFTEPEDYLRKAGALAEDADGGKQVLIANYLLGPSNCIASSEYFSVCCLNSCEDIVSELEEAIHAPAAVFETMKAAVSAIYANRDTSDDQNAQSAEQPLPANLVGELQTLVDASGAITLHSAAFRQWLHHAFPLECPLPSAAEQDAEEKELREAKEWQRNDKENQIWQPIMPNETQHCTRLTEWHEMTTTGPAPVVEI